ncbi:MAG TPA: ABC transporter substrate-binding protein [Bradyrhizobium sp.]|jgi:putative ABC transport system substrate-binding protein|uniref:ABC transporter substrate-binding protein n=1 Tax=Bradyrhizobium sp. TaxID=376 RepID=UPI002B5DCEDB|nr:ABC transporter substrate-binding protein [Bradyrhizobium sp.]HTB02531.1 ABC transporter substrate-binding protein [Bradyrhizobium sp.]
MRRREFITLVGGAAATWPLAARAQHAGKIWRIGVLSGNARPAAIETSFLGGLAEGMRALGYVEGRDFVIEWRFAEAKPERYAEFAEELARLNADIFVAGAPEAVRYFQKAAPQTPIVMALSTDPVGNGFATSLAHPGGNITGLATSLDDTASKQLELLMEAVPHLASIGILANSSSPNYASVARNLFAATQARGLNVAMADVRTAEEFDTAFARLKGENVQALMLGSNVLFNLNRVRIAEFAIKNRLPSVFGVREYVEAGGLMSYGESFRDFFRRSAGYVDKIIKGARAGDLPIEQPNRFYFTINLKTAKAIGLELPAALVLRADEVME